MGHNIIYISICLAYSLFFPATISSQESTARQPIIFGVNPSFGTLPIIAEKEGFFKEEGLDVKIKELNVGKIIADSLVSEDIDFGTIVDSNLAFFGFHHTKIKVVASLGSRQTDSIYFRNNLDILKPSDLIGKRIGYIPGTPSHIFLARFLSANKIAWANIKPIIIQPHSANVALRNGSVDAISIWQPHGYNLETEFKDHILSFSNSETIYPSRMYLASTTPILRARPDILKPLLRALKKAEDLYNKHPKKVAPYLAQRIGCSESEVSQVLEKYHFQLGADDSSIALLNETGKWISKTIENYHNLPLPDYKLYFSELEKEIKAYTPVTFCRPNNMVSALFYIAEQKNYFKEEGIDPQFETATNAKLCQDMLIARRSDYMAGAEGPFTYLAVSKPPVKALAVIQKNPETAIFARKDRGIEKFSDLKGKRIGYLPGTVSYFFLGRVLKKYNIALTEIKLTPMQPPSMPQALIGGAVDAYSMWEPWGTMAKSGLQDNLIALEEPSTYQYLALLTAHNEAIEKDKTVPLKILKALIRASKFIATNNQEAFSILKDAIKFEETSFKKLWAQYDHSIWLDKGLLTQMQENFNLLKEDDKNFEDATIPQFQNFIDSSFLKEVDPSLVKDEM